MATGNLPDHSFNLCFQHIDDLVVFNNKFWEYVKDIYPSQLNDETTKQCDNLASYLDLTFTVEKDGKFSTKLYGKRDDFDFHIVKFPFLSSVYHLALLMVFTCHSSLDMQDAAHTMMISDNVEKLVSQGY